MSNSCCCCQTKGMLLMWGGIILMLQQIKYKIRIAKDSCQGRNTTDQDQQKSKELRSCFPIQSSSFLYLSNCSGTLYNSGTQSNAAVNIPVDILFLNNTVRL